MYGLVECVWAARRLGDQDLARRILSRAYPEDDSSRGQLTRLATALVAEADGDQVEALANYESALAFFTARRWAGSRLQALAWAGRTRLALGETATGLERLREARTEAVALGYELLLSDIDAAIASVPVRAGSPS